MLTTYSKEATNEKNDYDLYGSSYLLKLNRPLRLRRVLRPHAPFPADGTCSMPASHSYTRVLRLCVFCPSCPGCARGRIGM